MTPISLMQKGETLKQATIRRVNVLGDRTCSTIELPMFTEYIEGLKEDREFWRDAIGADVDLVEAIFKAILEGDNGVVLGPYNSKYYTFLRRAMNETAKKFRDNGLETRQAVIHFPKDHCFTSIQVIARNPVNHSPLSSNDFNVYITVNMRSCNVVDNYVDDLYLAYLVSMRTLGIARRLLSHPLPIAYTAMCVAVGSLHKFNTTNN